MKQLFFICLVFLFASCDNEEPVIESNDETLVSKSAFDSYLNTRESNTAHYFELKDIVRSGEQLEITILGQCQASYYRVIWDGSVMFSSPAQINLLVAFELPEGVVCDLSMKEHKLIVNLKDLLGDNYDDTEYIIHVLNGSQVQDKTSHPDGNMTDKS